MNQQEYFQKNLASYTKAVGNSEDLYRKTGKILERYLRGTVIDCGNGGIINYSLENIDKLICLDIIFNSSSGQDQKIVYSYGDFYSFYAPVEPDVVLAQFLFHHLVDDSRLLNSLISVNKSLQENGRLIIAEVKLPHYIQAAQKIIQPMLNTCMDYLDKPKIRFFSKQSLADLLNKAGFMINSYHEIKIQGSVNPAPVIFPDLKIPGRLYPFKLMIVEALPVNRNFIKA